MMDGFAESVQIFVDRAKANADEVVRATGLKILARLIQRSPVGNPELWAVNTGAVRQRDRAADINAALRSARKKARVQLAGAKYSSNTSAVGPRKPRKLKRGQGEMYYPKGYTGGRFRGNWQIGFDSAPEGETDRIDKSGAETLAAGGAMLAQFKAANNSVIYFVNNVPYAVRLEFGYSSQAPRGMVRITAQEFQKLFNEAAKQVNQ